MPRSAFSAVTLVSVVGLFAVLLGQILQSQRPLTGTVFPFWGFSDASASMSSELSSLTSTDVTSFSSESSVSSAPAQFVISINDGRSTGISYETLADTVTVTNISNVSATVSPTVSLLPFSYLPAVAVNGGSYDPTLGVVSWPPVSIAAGASKTFSFQPTVVLPGFLAQIPLTAVAQAGGSTGQDTTIIFAASSSSSISVFASAASQSASLQASASASFASASAASASEAASVPAFALTNAPSSSVILFGGSPVNFTVTLRNTGAAPAAGVPVSLNLPATLHLLSASAGGMFDGSQVHWTVPFLAPGASATLVASVKLDAILPERTGITAIAQGPAGLTDSATLTVAAPVPPNGCIEVQKIAQRSDGTPLTGDLPPFSFTLHRMPGDGGIGTVVSDAAGSAVFFDVAPGTYTVAEQLSPPWIPRSVSPADGSVTVPSGGCVTVQFTNAQPPPPTVSVSSAPPPMGCIDVHATITGLPSFFTALPSLDLRVTPANATSAFIVHTNGLGAAHVNVAPGAYAVSLLPQSGFHASGPSSHAVTVTPGAACAQASFTYAVTAAQPIFTVSNTDLQTTAVPGQTLAYTITVTNASAVPSTGPLLIKDVLPPTEELLTTEGSAVGSSYAQASRTVTWTIPSLSPGAVVSLSLQATVNASLPDGTRIDNTAAMQNGPSATDTTLIRVVPASAEGCIRIVNHDLDVFGNFLSWMPAATFFLDGNQNNAVLSNGPGIALMPHVPVGFHSVTELLPLSTQPDVQWKLVYASPGPFVMVPAGNCTELTVVNRQILGNTPVPSLCGDGICAPWLGENCVSCTGDCGVCPMQPKNPGPASTQSQSTPVASTPATSTPSASVSASIAASRPGITSAPSTHSTPSVAGTIPDLWCDARMIFPPACPVYAPDTQADQTLDMGTVMFGGSYAPSATQNPYNIPSPLDCTAVCAAAKSIGQCFVPGTGCVQMRDTDCAGGMFFRYTDHASCTADCALGICAGHP